MRSTFQTLAASSISRVSQTLIGVLIGFLMMPFMIGSLGDHLYGIWVIVGSITSSYFLLDLGFAGAVTRFAALEIAREDYTEANRVINTSLAIYIILTLLIGAATLLVAYFSSQLVNDIADAPLVRTLLIITGLSLALEFPAKAFVGIIAAYLRYDLIAYSRTFYSVFTASLIYGALSAGYGLISVAVISFITSQLSTVTFLVIASRLHKPLSIRIRLVSRRTLKRILSFSSWNFMADASLVVKHRLDLWLIAYYISAATLTIYYVGIRLVDYCINFLNQATDMATPLFTRYEANNNQAEMMDKLLIFVKINTALAGLTFVLMISLGSQFITLWMGPDFDSRTAYLCMAIVLAGRLLAYSSAPFISVLIATANIQFVGWLSVVETVFAAVLCILLVPHYGATGIALGVSIPYVLTRTLILPRHATKCINGSLGSILKGIIPAIFVAVAFGVASYSLISTLPLSLDYPGMIVFSCLSLLTYSLLQFLFLEKSEKRLILALLPISQFRIRKR